MTSPMPVGDDPQELNCQITETALSVTTNEDIRTYEWEGPNPASLSDPSAESPIVTEPGTYSVTVTAADNGCTAVETIIVTQDENIPESIPMGSELTCDNPTVELNGSLSTPPSATISYSWTNPLGIEFSTDVITTTDLPGEYTLTVSNSANFCNISATVTITQDILPPTANAGMDNVFACADEFVTLSASASSGQGTLSYEWLNDTGAEIGTGETIDVTGTGDFTVIVTDSDNGCTSTDVVTITPDVGAPGIDIAEPETLTCAVTSVELNASNTTGIGALSFSWTLNGIEIGTEETISVTTPGLYMLQVIDGSNGCESAELVMVNLDNATPSADAIGGEIDCNSGETDVVLSNILATNPSYSWTGPNEFMATTQDLAGVTDPGEYTVIVTDGNNGCTFMTTATVTENSLTPPAAIDPAEMLDCDTEVIQLNGQAAGNLSFSWDGPGIISGGNTLTPTVDQPGEYILTVRDPANGCATVESVTVTENENVITAINPEGDDVNCFGPNTGSISIGSSQVTGGEAPFVYSIDGGDSFSTQEDFLGLVAGTYDVVVMDINGCLFNESLTINPAEDLFLDYGENLVIAFGDSITLVPDLNFDIAEAIWSDSTLIGPTPNVRPTSTTTFEIDAFDENGCPITDQITIFVEKTRPVFIPSGFSPNGDGINDVFTVFADLDLITSIKNLSIYDRWGEQMFFKEEMTPAEALQEMNGWNGEYRGEEMNPGVFVYHVLVEFIDGEEIFFEGDVTLVR